MPERQEIAAFFENAQSVEKYVKWVLDPAGSALGWLVGLAVDALKWWNRTQYGHPEDFKALSRIYKEAAEALEEEADKLAGIADRTGPVWRDKAGDAARRRIRDAEEKVRERSQAFADVAEIAEVLYEAYLIVEDIAYALIAEVLKSLATKKIDAKKEWAVIEAARDLPPLAARLMKLLVELSGAMEKVKPVIERLVGQPA